MKSKEINVKDLQNILLDIMINFHNICKENNIKYYLSFGTLLGAIRHNGFIPWDDDVDIMMSRDDFNRFCDIVKNNIDLKYKLIMENNNIASYHCVYKYCNTDVEILEWYIKCNPWIDIYIMDKCPNKYLGKTLNKLNKLKRNRALTKEVLDERSKHLNTPKYVKILNKINKIISFSIFFNLSKIDKNIFENLIKYNDYKLDDYSYIIYDCKILSLKKEYFNNMILHKFEQFEFYIPENYDLILKDMYGDYMNLPPKEEQIMRHNISLVIDD